MKGCFFLFYSLLLVAHEALAQGIPPAIARPITAQTDTARRADDVETVVVTGTMRAISVLDSPIPVEVYTPAFIRQNPVPTLFDALQNVNGVRPQLNCNVCNTGDIHINGMEGPYTMVLIDGMPIVSSLSTVYGLSGIPSGLIDRIEVVKGPASTLYGSEAVGGLINVITKNPASVPNVTFEAFGTSHGELNADVGIRFRAGKSTALLGVNAFLFNAVRDVNDDGFTDLTLQKRISLFNKWAFVRRNPSRTGSLAARVVAENRWGGQTAWTPDFWGGDSLYGEAIHTRRWEIIGNESFQLAGAPLRVSYSVNEHRQHSTYGTMLYDAVQRVGFAQAVWDKHVGERHDILLGAATRHTWYDDNTPATERNARTAPSKTLLPGIFAQDEIRLHEHHLLLAGVRLDHHPVHGPVFSPRAAWKYAPDKRHLLRLNVGNGFRTVNIFTEDHAALTGARTVVIREALRPERSWNANLNYRQAFVSKAANFSAEASFFYTYFANKIVPDYLTDPNLIIYQNLRGHAVSRGISLNTEAIFSFPLRINLGATLMQVYQIRQDSLGNAARLVQLQAPPFSGTFSVSYTFAKANVVLDWTGNLSAPMLLPILPNDFRPERSPWYSLQNVQVTKRFNSGLQFFAGVKNILDFLPLYPIIRPFDPFDKHIAENNPNNYTFDPSYNYAPVQGIRSFAGVRWSFLR